MSVRSALSFDRGPAAGWSPVNAWSGTNQVMGDGVMRGLCVCVSVRVFGVVLPLCVCVCVLARILARVECSVASRSSHCLLFHVG